MKRIVPITVLAVTAFALGGCDSDGGSLSGPEHESVVIGSVHSGSAAMAAPVGAGSAPMADVSASAESVVIGEVRSNGGVRVLAEAQVDAQGDFRIEGVPSGRTDLVIVARSESNAEVGRVILMEETRAGAEHRAPPIDGRTTLHGRVWAAMQANGGSSMSSAELALFLDIRSDVAASAAADAATVTTLARAGARADAAITAVLESEGNAMSAGARGALLLALAVQRDRDRANGASAEVTQRAYVEGAVAVMAQEGVQLEALALAWASASTRVGNEVENTDESTRLEVVRGALLVNLEARKRIAASVQGGSLGLRAEVQGHLGRLETRIRGASTWAELRASLEGEQAELVDRVTGGLHVALSVLPPEARLQAELAIIAALEASDLRGWLSASASAAAHATAIAGYRTELNARAEAAIEAIPSAVLGGLTAEAMVSLLIAVGGCATLA